MPVCRGFAVDGAKQIECFDDAFGRQIEEFVDTRFDLLFRDISRSVRIDHDRDRFDHTDGIGDLDGHLFTYTGGHQIFRHISGRIGAASVYLGRIFSAECPATVRTAAAIGVDDDLAPRKSRIALRPADDESSGGIDMVDDVFVQQIFGDYVVDVRGLRCR